MAPKRQTRPPSGQMRLDRSVDGPWVNLTVSGELDFMSAPELRAAIAPDTLPDGRVCVAMDLAGVTFCDSSALGVLLGTSRKLQERGGQLTLRQVPACLARRLQTTGIGQLISPGQILDTNEKHRRD